MNYPTPFSESLINADARLDFPVLSESQSVSRAQRGDLNAFNQLILAYQDIVFRQAFWILREEAAAEDAVQDAFLMAYCKLGTFRGGSFRSWILRITINYCLDQIRSAHRRPSVRFDPADVDGKEIEPIWMKDPRETLEQLIERTETNELINFTIQKLSIDSRMVVLLVDLQDLNYIEASNVLQIPVGTVKSRLARARRKLGENLQVSWKI
jgi:RNA polymerase sigma-70 factor (ECF subfamily)